MDQPGKEATSKAKLHDLLLEPRHFVSEIASESRSRRARLLVEYREYELLAFGEGGAMYKYIFYLIHDSVMIKTSA